MNAYFQVPVALVYFAGSACAETFSCQGASPDWQLTFDKVQAEFVFPAPTQLDVMLETLAEGADEWPRAYTLIGERDTAIVLIEQESCGANADHRSHIMTQRGETPILLTGCCEVQE